MNAFCDRQAKAQYSSPLAHLKANLIYRRSHAEAALKDSAVVEADHTAHMAELMRHLAEEKKASEELVDDAIAGVHASLGRIYSDEEWPQGMVHPCALQKSPCAFRARLVSLLIYYECLLD